jgi:hypothetical protein
MAKNLPKTQEEARGILAQQLKDTVDAYNAAKRAGDETQAKQLLQQYRDLNNQWEAAKEGAGKSFGRGLLSGATEGLSFINSLMRMGRSDPFAEKASETWYAKHGKPVHEPQSQEQLIPLRAGQAIGSTAVTAPLPGTTVKNTLLGLGLSGADIAAETQGADRGVVSTAFLLGALGKAGWGGFRASLDKKKITKLLDDLPSDSFSNVDKNHLKDLMLKGQGTDNAMSAALIQRLKSNPQFSEYFTAMEKAATERTLQGMTPDTGGKTREEAATGVVEAIQKRLENIRLGGGHKIVDENGVERTVHAAHPLFEKAKKVAGDAAVVTPEKTLQAIDGLIADFSKTAGTDDSRAALAYLTKLRQEIQPEVNVGATAGTSVTRAGEPSRTIPGAQARTETRQRVVTEYDSMGMPRQRVVTESYPVAGSAATTIPGTPDVNLNIPGSAGYSVTQGTQGWSAAKTQAYLSQFGRKTGPNNQLVKDVSVDTDARINKVLFGALKDDLTEAAATNTGATKVAAESLLKARDMVSQSSQAYNKAIATGLPKYLQNASPHTVNFDTLAPEYMKMSPTERATVREWLSSDPSSLQHFDRSVYQSFVNKAKDSQGAVDLSTLTANWNKASEAEKQAINTALGENAGEWNARMRDASAFVNRVKVGQPKVEPTTLEKVAPDVGRAVGTTMGYSAKQAVDLTADIAKKLLDKTKLSDEQLMQLMISPEGKDFLKSAKLSSTSGAKLLEGWDKVTTPPTPPTQAVMQTGQFLSPEQTQQPTTELPPIKLDLGDEQQQQPQSSIQLVD